MILTPFIGSPPTTAAAATIVDRDAPVLGDDTSALSAGIHSSGVVGSMNTDNQTEQLQQYYDLIDKIVESNQTTALAEAAYAAERDRIAWNRQQKADEVAYNRSLEADLNKFVRAKEGLLAAGLNPALAASSGMTSAVSAHAGSYSNTARANYERVDQSVANALIELLKTNINSATSIMNTGINTVGKLAGNLIPG